MRPVDIQSGLRIVIENLEKIGIDYMIVGSVAGTLSPSCSKNEFSSAGSNSGKAKNSNGPQVVNADAPGANTSQSLKWLSLRESFAVCLSDALPACPANWKQAGVFYCTTEATTNTSTATAGQDGDILNKVKINKTSSTCPPTHSLFADKCVAPSKNNTRLNFAYSPMANVCPTFCNEFGCQWLPDNTTTSVVVCIEEELPICAADWKVTGNEKCHL
jgi:hypothetical protein